MPSILCSAQASYKKLSGLLELTDTHLQWTKNGDKIPAVRFPYADAAGTCQKRVCSDATRSLTARILGLARAAITGNHL